ncbi:MULTISPECIES: Npun_F0813 family protein [unclassified Microcoleus]|uniref:Npun_F0813 family protein n=1 Tax=unclassified Microcoleus TaxID=2642155 RepID=UPI0025CC059B|nr:MULTISPECIES: Npun_F0813 family protein [unclassified Microcoleus]
MFILKRQDVEISNFQHPKRDQQIPILNYQGQTFRLISAFNGKQAEDARALWRDLTDNRGKACVLLEEPDRYSVWGKVRLDQLAGEEPAGTESAKAPLFAQGCLLLLQAVYFDVEDLLGARQATSFQKDITKVFQQGNFPQADSADAIKNWLTVSPLQNHKVPPWQDQHLKALLQELHRLGKSYFGNTDFAEGVSDVLQDMPAQDRTQFLDWLKQSALNKLWIAG